MHPLRCDPIRLHKFLVSVKEASSTPEPDFSLARVCISITGLPTEAKQDHILKMVSEPVGKMVAVDVGSLEGEGHACIQILCPDPARIDGLILPFYFNTTGVRLTFELDTEDPEVVPEGASPRPSPPAHSGPGDGGDDSASSEESSDGGGSQESLSCHPPGTMTSSSLGQASLPAVSLVLGLVLASSPAASDARPTSPLPFLCMGSPRTQAMVEEEDSLSVGMDSHAPSSPRSPGVVCYSRSPGSPPAPAQGPLAMMIPVTLTPPGLGLSTARSDTPVGDPMGGPSLHSSPSPPIAYRQSARLGRSRADI